MTPSMATAAWVCVIAPFVGGILTPFVARLGSAARVTCVLAFSFVSAAAALSLLPGLFRPESLPIESVVAWLDVPIRIDFGLLIDPLSIVLTNVVAVISFVILIYCVGYMKGDPAETRFWMWMTSFIGSMLLLVLANNLLFLFIGWKLVGFCSYGLIGFYYADQRNYWIGGPAPSNFVKPSEACLKALVVTGAGDMLMLAGILLLYFYAGTLNFLELYATVPTWLAAMAAQPGMVLLVSLLLLAGPLGKSAQFPFHEWLPEAMAGPGPVSALIHAATMVKSGVYLVARLVPLFYYGYWIAEVDAAGWFFTVTACIGAFTAFLAATQAIVAIELKKVMAYSTISQIGYMMLALGAAGLVPGILVNGYTAGIFHLISHAFFKACLFLCAGTVIHAFHSIYINDMGASRQRLPLTWGFMLIASLSLMGVPPFPGFWSKDAVLLATLEANPLLFTVSLFTSGLTAFYTLRYFALVFHDKCRKPLSHSRNDDPTQADDGTASMRWASGLLAVLIIVSGGLALALEGTLHHAFEVNLSSQLPASFPATGNATGNSHIAVGALSVLVVLLGATPAYYLYMAGKASPDAIIASSTPVAVLHRFFWRRWEIDALYRRVFVNGSTRLATVVANDIETRWDHAVHRWLPWLVMEKSQRLLHRLRADTEELVYNVSYILIVFVMLLTYLFLGAD